MTLDSEPSDADRAKVRSMIIVGVPPDLIARRMGCSVDELGDRFETELRRAGPEARASVGASLFAAAKKGNIPAIIFWLKTRAGWSEGVRREISAPDGGAVAIDPGPWAVVVLPCNGRGMCPKITDPQERREAYERCLGRKLDKD